MYLNTTSTFNNEKRNIVDDKIALFRVGMG